MRTLLTTVSLLTLISCQGIAAQNEEKQPSQAEKLAQFLERFPEADTNKDGTLTIEEVRAFNKDREPSAEQIAKFLERFPKADADKDGILTLEEIRAFNQTRQQGGETREARPKRPAPTHADVAYGDHERQTFDLWIAESADGKPTPLIIYIHGGGFRAGSKNNVNPETLQAYLDAGISFASMGYRLSDVGPYPIMMHDAARGLQTIRSRAEEWNLNPEKVACFGGSAGAGISLWLGFHNDLAKPKSEDPVARQSTRILAAGTINGQPTYDMRTYREWFEVPNLPPHTALLPFYGMESEEEMETEQVQKLMVDASPISHLTEDDVPVYMSYGSGNTPVDENTGQGAWVHHVLLGLKLQEAMSKLNLECQVMSPEHPVEGYKNMEDFFIQKLTE